VTVIFMERKKDCLPTIVASWSKEGNVFACSNNEIMGSNVSHGISVSLFVLPCIDRSPTASVV
jgi:hypothetical protein